MITNIEQNFTEGGVRGTRITYTAITGGAASYAFIPNGATGATPVISIIDGEWAVNGVKTGQQAQGVAGEPGAPGAAGTNGDYVKVEADKPIVGSTTITVMDGTTKTPKTGIDPVIIKNGEQGVKGESVTARIEDGALKIYSVTDKETLIGQIKAPKIESVYDYAESMGKMTVVITNYNFDGTEVSPKQYILTDLPEDTSSLLRYVSQTDNYYTFALGDGTEMRVLRRVPAVPQSVTMLNSAVNINRHGEAVVKFRVNPSNVVIPNVKYVDLDYVSETRAIVGNAPMNVLIKGFRASEKTEGEYEVTLGLANPEEPNFGNNESIFIIVNYTDPNLEANEKPPSLSNLVYPGRCLDL